MSIDLQIPTRQRADVFLPGLRAQIDALHVEIERLSQPLWGVQDDDEELTRRIRREEKIVFHNYLVGLHDSMSKPRYVAV
jgi:hypothetical protein